MTLDQPAAVLPLRPPGFWWRVLSPVGAVLVSFLALIIAGGVLYAATDMSDTAIGAVVTPLTSLLLLGFAFRIRRRLPAHEQRLALAVKGPAVKAVLTGVAVGLGIVAGAAIIISAGAAIDPVVERRLNEVEDIGTAPWQIVLMVIALVLLAPLGEELLFRGLILRGLVRRMRFWFAALISSALFAAAHFDSWILWPRTITLFGTGLVLAWVYRQRGYWGSVAAHATVNTIAAIALIATS